MAKAQREPASIPVPPQSLDAEESVLGAMMLSERAIASVSEIVSDTDFYRESHGRIYRAALALWAKGEPVDAITLTDELERGGELEQAGGRARIHELAAIVPASGNASHYARIVHESATLRALIRAGGDIARLGWEGVGEPVELVDQAEQIIFELGRNRDVSEAAYLSELLKESFQRLAHLYESGEELTGISSGFRDLDKLLLGLQPATLVVVAARPSVGKSAFALALCAHAALVDERPVALFTLEMSRQEVVQRLIAAEAKVELQRIRSGRLTADDWSRVTLACDRLSKAPLIVDDNSLPTALEIRAKARRLKAKHPDLALVCVDYLQLLTPGVQAENRVQEVAQITRSLKLLARDLELPVIALSQLSRAVEQRHDKRPLLSDLRESGTIEQDSDVVIFLYRDELVVKETEEPGVAEVIVAKHRNGPTATIRLAFLKRYARFADLASES